MSADVAARAADTYRDLARERRWIADHGEDLLRHQLEIAGIPAPTGEERSRAAHVAERLRTIGLTPRIDDAGNVVARAPGAYDADPVVVCAHLDTVFPAGTPLDVRREGALLVGPGVCDNSRGLAVMLMLAQVVHTARAGLPRPIEFVATTGEEGTGDLRGARHYFGRARPPHAVIAIDGAGDERIINTGLGSRRFRIGFCGPGGHSWNAFGTVNPVHAAARTAVELADLRAPRGARARLALSVNRIGGGMAINSLPEDAWIEVDARSTDDTILDRVERSVREVTARAAAHANEQRTPGTAPLRYVVERIGDRPGGATASDSPLVAAAIEATRLVGREPELATASTDANAAMHIGAPAIAIGGGGKGGAAHSRREWFDGTDAVAGVERALTIVATMARNV
jgi:tripeptide aminopeptidase